MNKPELHSDLWYEYKVIFQLQRLSQEKEY